MKLILNLFVNCVLAKYSSLMLYNLHKSEWQWTTHFDETGWDNCCLIFLVSCVRKCWVADVIAWHYWLLCRWLM